MNQREAVLNQGAVSNDAPSDLGSVGSLFSLPAKTSAESDSK